MIKYPVLNRELGLFGATMMGLGSILGSGIFVSLGIAAGVAGPSVILAIILAAVLALCNALSSAQLAANYPVSGGTYEYGYHYLNSWFGFTAGWLFLLAKTASATTAALGFSAYFLYFFHLDFISLLPIAIFIVIVLTGFILSGLRQSNRLNIVIVLITVSSLLIFIFFGLPCFKQHANTNLTGLFSLRNNLNNFFYATALMFVAYTGYGRIATLGEEVKNPQIFIPRAIILTLVLSGLLYITVALIAVGCVGAYQLAPTIIKQASPLEMVSTHFGFYWLPLIVSIGAMSALLGVLFNLMLGLSRVVLAMARNGDLPALFSNLTHNKVPYTAILLISFVIIILCFTESVELTWSFSAFTVLIYYAITNLAALKIPKEKKYYTNIFPICGLFGSLFLAFWVPLKIWLLGLALIAIGLVWHLGAKFIKKA